MDQFKIHTGEEKKNGCPLKFKANIQISMVLCAAVAVLPPATLTEHQKPAVPLLCLPSLHPTDTTSGKARENSQTLHRAPKINKRQLCWTR